MKTAIVTGGAGFLGSHLVSALIRDGFFVIAIDNFSSGYRENTKFLEQYGAKLCLIEEDVVNPWQSWEGLVNPQWLSKLKYIFHFASPASPKIYQRLSIETMRVNSLGLEQAILFANKYEAKVIFASTSEIYGDPECSPQSESYNGNVNSYGARSCYDEAKRFGEALIYSYNLRNGTKHGLIRIFNTYGPRMNPQDGRVIINLLTQAINGNDLSVYGTGLQTRSFCYVDDLIDGVLKYAYQDISEPLNIGNPQEISILDLINEIRGLFSHKSLNIVHSDLPIDDPRRRNPDIEKALKILAPWKPRVSLEQGMKKMLHWLEGELIIS